MYPGTRKTYELLRKRYYWKGIKSFIAQYVANCHPYQRAHLSRDKTPGWLHALPVPEYPWQHICVDFKAMPEDNEGYNIIIVFINCLSKKVISLPYKKTTTAKDLAELYAVYYYRYVGLLDSVVSNKGA